MIGTSGDEFLATSKLMILHIHLFVLIIVYIMYNVTMSFTSIGCHHLFTNED